MSFFRLYGFELSESSLLSSLYGKTQRPVILSTPAGRTHGDPSDSERHACGLPSPADDFLEGSLDLNSLVVRHPEATFFARVEGDSMKDEGITEGDLLVVDKAVEPYDGCLAVAYLEGEFTLKRVRIEPERILLVPANPKYPAIEIDPDTEFAVWGVVSYIVKKA